MVSFRHSGDFLKTSKFLKRVKTTRLLNVLHKYGKEGVAVLMSATPVDTGLTAISWRYEIRKENNSIKLVFCNDNIQNGVQIAVIIQYGHGTRNGGWVEGIDYINPAIQPVFDKIAKSVWKEAIK